MGRGSRRLLAERVRSGKRISVTEVTGGYEESGRGYEYLSISDDAGVEE